MLHRNRLGRHKNRRNRPHRGRAGNRSPARKNTPPRLRWLPPNHCEPRDGVGYSPRVKPDEFLPLFSRLLGQGAMFYRDGSGALTIIVQANRSLRRLSSESIVPRHFAPAVLGSLRCARDHASPRCRAHAPAIDPGRQKSGCVRSL
jgi:hypothetical protein